MILIKTITIKLSDEDYGRVQDYKKRHLGVTYRDMLFERIYEEESSSWSAYDAAYDGFEPDYSVGPRTYGSSRYGDFG